MKRVIDLLTALALFSMIIFVGCKKDDDDDDNDTTDPNVEQAEKLTKKWNVSSVTFDDVPRDDFDGFAVTFTGDETGGDYTTENLPDGAEVVWAVTGPWTFGETISDIERGDLAPATISTLTETSLTLTINNAPASRVAGFEGSWVFSFTAAE